MRSSDKPIVCPDCLRPFETRLQLNQHCEAKHGKLKPRDAEIKRLLEIAAKKAADA